MLLLKINVIGPPIRKMRKFLKILGIFLGLILLFGIYCYRLGRDSSLTYKWELTEDERSRLPLEFEIDEGIGEGNVILVPGSVGGEHTQFVLDTGTTSTIFNDEFQSLLGEPVGSVSLTDTNENKTAGNKQTFLFPEAFIGPLRIRGSEKTILIDCSSMEGTLGVNIGGLLGMDFLKSVIIQLDFDRQNINILNPDSKPSRGWGEEIPINFRRDGIPYLSASVAGNRISQMVIDTGSTHNKIPRELFDRIGREKGLPYALIWFASASGTSFNKLARFGSLRVGSSEYEGILASEGGIGSLGLPFLSRHVVTFDFPRGRMYLKPGNQFNKVFAADMSGLRIGKRDDEVSVASVDPTAPAGAAGFKRGDIIISINNVPVHRQPIWRVRELFKSGDGIELEVLIRRETEEIPLALTLKKWL